MNEAAIDILAKAIQEATGDRDRAKVMVDRCEADLNKAKSALTWHNDRVLELENAREVLIHNGRQGERDIAHDVITRSQ